MLPRNESHFDRAFRIVLGIAILSLLFVGPKSWWALVGIVPLATGIIGFCPLYRVLGISTCELPPSPPRHA